MKKEAILHCSTNIEELWWTDGKIPKTLCGAPCERYRDNQGTEWLLCSLPGHFLGDISNTKNPSWVRVNDEEIYVVKCQECLDHKDMPLLALAAI